MSRVGKAEVHIPVAEIAAEYEAWLPEIVNEVAKELLIETKAQAVSAPFEDHTGYLRKSIRRRKSRFDKNAVIVGAFAPHTHLVEYGTSLRKSPKTGKTSGHMPATPFMRRAAEKVRDRLPEIIARVVNK